MPHHYREPLSEQNNLMRREGVIKDVDPNKPIICVLNMVITEKGTPGEIRIYIDATPINKGAKIEKYHIKTAAEV